MFIISGSEPLLQKEEVLTLIEAVEKKTNYSIGLATNGSLIDANFVEEANTLGRIRLIYLFAALDTEHSNQSIIDALKLVGDKFEGLTAVSLIPFSCVDAAAFSKICEFLHGINPNLAIKIYHPFYPDNEREEWEKNTFPT